jgi:DNA-binding PadR family transcriptional regulator
LSPNDTPTDLVQGTPHMLILKTLALQPMHGYGIGVRLEQISRPCLISLVALYSRS